MLRWLLFTLVLISQTVLAEGSNSIILNGISKHIDVNDDAFPNGLNEKNWGLGYEYNFEKAPDQSIEWLLNTGFYKDSLSSTAVYAGGAGLIQIAQVAPVKLKIGIEGSGFYSSEYNQGRPFIALMPIFNIGTDRISINIAIIPKVSQFMDAGVIFAQLKFKL
jgi:hypothetical protein